MVVSVETGASRGREFAVAAAAAAATAGGGSAD